MLSPWSSHHQSLRASRLASNPSSRGDKWAWVRILLPFELGMDDEALEALADGGHQVGAIAKLMFRSKDPEAVEVVARDHDAQIRETTALLQRESVTIFEATIQHETLLVRSDVLVKRGNQVDLI